jgi:hypothetical protein
MNQYRKERCIEIAKKLSDLRTGRSLHFSFILDKNKLLITAANSYKKSHPQKQFGIYVPARPTTNYQAGLHSEISAIKTFLSRFRNTDFSGLTLFNVRIGKDGLVQMAAPCKNCQKVLDSFNFKAILHT